ncbi:MAG: DUF4101 domain-containing protein [Cyanothece sp. SIO1E1]|nr:DUF4101 domain-containing protein [Cyanothece sp. SIO1E1]
MSALSHASEAIEVLVLYAQADKSLLSELATRLSPLKEQTLITGWHDCELTAEVEPSSQVIEHLQSADMTLLMVSPDLLASKCWQGDGLKSAVQRHEEGKAILVPILLKPVENEAAELLAQLDPLPSTGAPLTDWEIWEEAYSNIVEGTQVALENFINQRYNHKLEQYEQLLVEELEKNYPLSDATRTLLSQKQQELCLKTADVVDVEQTILKRKAAEHQKSIFWANLKSNLLSWNKVSVLIAIGLTTTLLGLFGLGIFAIQNSFQPRDDAQSNQDNPNTDRVTSASIEPALTSPRPVELAVEEELAQKATSAEAASKQKSEVFTQAKAVGLIQSWLTAKSEIFGSNYNLQLANQLTTGERNQQIQASVKWLKDNKAYYKYYPFSLGQVNYFSAADDKAEIHLEIAQPYDYYTNDKSQRNPGQGTLAGFGLQFTNGQWRIACAAGNVNNSDSLQALKTCLSKL